MPLGQSLIPSSMCIEFAVTKLSHNMARESEGERLFEEVKRLFRTDFLPEAFVVLKELGE